MEVPYPLVRRASARLRRVGEALPVHGAFPLVSNTPAERITLSSPNARATRAIPLLRAPEDDPKSRRSERLRSLARAVAVRGPLAAGR